LRRSGLLTEDLAADEAGLITGSTLSIDGGQHMC
jgi:hypothetical protein